MAMGKSLVGMPAFTRSSTKYSSSTLLTDAKLENRARILAGCPLRRISPAPPGQVGHSSTMGNMAPADLLAIPGVAPSMGELSQFAGQLEDPGGPSRLMRSSEQPLYLWVERDLSGGSQSSPTPRASADMGHGKESP